MDDIINEIIDTMQNSGFDCFGLRKDKFDYSVGDRCNVSHELYQDAEYDDNDELVYPYCEDGIYKGYYDAGELDGTSAIKISLSDSKSVISGKIDKMSMYHGDGLFLIAGDSCQRGNDNSEIIITDAVVIYKF